MNWSEKKWPSLDDKASTSSYLKQDSMGKNIKKTGSKETDRRHICRQRGGFGFRRFIWTPPLEIQGLGWFMVFNATFNNISVILWWSVHQSRFWLNYDHQTRLSETITIKSLDFDPWRHKTVSYCELITPFFQ